MGNQLPVNQRVQGNHQAADGIKSWPQKFVCGCHWLVTVNKEVVVVRYLLFEKMIWQINEYSMEAKGNQILRLAIYQFSDEDEAKVRVNERA